MKVNKARGCEFWIFPTLTSRGAEKSLLQAGRIRRSPGRKSVTQLHRACRPISGSSRGRSCLRIAPRRSEIECLYEFYLRRRQCRYMPAGRPAQVLLIFRRDLCIPASTATAGQADLTSGQWSRPDPLPTGQRLFSVIVNEYSPAVFAVAGSKRASNGE